jgi:hypothetical protein
VRSDVNAGFGVKKKRMAVGCLPFYERGQQFCFDAVFISDEIVIHDENRAVSAKVIERLYFIFMLPYFFYA